MAEFVLSFRKGGLVACPPKDVDVKQLDEIFAELIQVLKDRRPQNLLIDMRHAAILQSSSLGRLVNANLVAEEVGCRMQLAGLQDAVVATLQRTLLMKEFSTFPDVETALQAWQIVERSDS